MKISIRRAVVGDSKAMAFLARDLGFRGSDEDFLDNLQAAMADPAVSLHVAESPEGILAGWAATERRNIVQAGRSLEVTALVVARNLRGAGVGRALMIAVESEARALGLPMVRLRSNVVRTEAHAFYEAIGYEVQKTQHCFVKRMQA